MQSVVAFLSAHWVEIGVALLIAERALAYIAPKTATKVDDEIVAVAEKALDLIPADVKAKIEAASPIK